MRNNGIFVKHIWYIAGQLVWYIAGQLGRGKFPRGSRPHVIQPRQYATSGARTYLTMHILLYIRVHVRVPAVAHSSDSYLMIHIFVSDSISLVDNVHGYELSWTELFACCIAFGMNSQGILDLKRILGFGLVIIFLGSSMYLVLSSKQLERLLIFVFHAHCA